MYAHPKEINIMKFIQKSLLFVSLLSVGAGLSSISSVEQVQAATKDSSAEKSLNDVTADNFYYRINKDEFIKASDIRIITNDNSQDSNMGASLEASDFKLEVSSPKASLYNKAGKKSSHSLSRGAICVIGDQDQFYESSYFKSSSHKLTSVDDGAAAL